MYQGQIVQQFNIVAGALKKMYFFIRQQTPTGRHSV